MRVRDAIKLAEDDGWQLVRMRGSHRQYKHPTNPGLVRAYVRFPLAWKVLGKQYLLLATNPAR